MNCEAEFSATISLTCACALRCKCRDMLVISNFNETIQFSEALFKALAWKPRPIFLWCARRASRHVTSKKPARLNNGHISNCQFNFVIMKWKLRWNRIKERVSKIIYNRKAGINKVSNIASFKLVSFLPMIYALLLMRRLKRECQFILIFLLFFASESAKINFLR